MAASSIATKTLWTLSSMQGAQCIAFLHFRCVKLKWQESMPQCHTNWTNVPPKLLALHPEPAFSDWQSGQIRTGTSHASRKILCAASLGKKRQGQDLGIEMTCSTDCYAFGASQAITRIFRTFNKTSASWHPGRAALSHSSRPGSAKKFLAARSFYFLALLACTVYKERAENCSMYQNILDMATHFTCSGPGRKSMEITFLSWVCCKPVKCRIINTPLTWNG